MPYRDAEEQKAYMRAWRAEHADQVRAYRREEILKKSLLNARVPSRRTIETHKLTTEEIRPIVTRVLQRTQSTPRSSQLRGIS